MDLLRLVDSAAPRGPFDRKSSSSLELKHRSQALLTNSGADFCGRKSIFFVVGQGSGTAQMNRKYRNQKGLVKGNCVGRWKLLAWKSRLEVFLKIKLWKLGEGRTEWSVAEVDLATEDELSGEEEGEALVEDLDPKASE